MNIYSLNQIRKKQFKLLLPKLLQYYLIIWFNSKNQINIPIDNSKDKAKNIFTKIDNLLSKVIEKETKAFDEIDNVFIKALVSIERTNLINLSNVKNVGYEEKRVNLED